MFNNIILPLKYLFLILALWANMVQSSQTIITTVNGDYLDVRDSIEDSIRGKGINIANILHASNMLNGTGEDYGIIKNTYVHAEIFEFCSVKISHEISQANPLNILLCPFKIAVYNLIDTPKVIHIIYTPPDAKEAKSKAAVAKIADLLASIVEEAIW